MNDFESRLANLERTNKRYRLGLVATLTLLGVLVSSGFGQVQPGRQQYPRDLVVDSITAQSINVYNGTFTKIGTNRINADFASVIEGSFDTFDAKAAKISDLASARAIVGQMATGGLSVRTAQGGDAILLAANAAGGSISIVDGSGTVVGLLSTRDAAGLLQLAGKGGFPALEAAADEKGGQFKTFNNRGKVLASIGQSRKGDGEIIAHNREGNRVCILSSDETADYGSILLQKQGGEALVNISGDEKGGLVKTMSGTNETARIPAKQP